MRRYLFRRLLRTLPAAWGIVSVLFLLSRSLSADMQRTQASEELLPTGRTLTNAERQAAEQRARIRLGLNEPLFYFSLGRPTAAQGGLRWHGLENQYHRWLMNLARGDLGQSYRDDQAVTHLLGQALAYTLPLTLGAATVALSLAVGLGLWLAQEKPGHQTLRTLLHGLDALPLFVVALALLTLLANPDALALFPAYGLGREVTELPAATRLAIMLYHLILPLISLVLVSLPSLTAQLDTALRQELQTNYAATARAKGLSAKLVLRRHALRNAFLPTVTALTDLLPALAAGTVVVEVIFALPGMGRLLAEAAAARDYPVLLGGVLVVVLSRLISHVLADWLYFQADPRIRLTS